MNISPDIYTLKISTVPTSIRMYYARQRRKWVVYPVWGLPFVVRGENFEFYYLEAAEGFALALLERDFNGREVAFLNEDDIKAKEIHFYKEITR